MLERVLCPTLVGRDEQLFTLEDALLAAHRGESRFIALGGVLVTYRRRAHR